MIKIEINVLKTKNDEKSRLSQLYFQTQLYRQREMCLRSSFLREVVYTEIHDSTTRGVESMNFDENGRVITNTTIVENLIKKRNEPIKRDLQKITDYFKITIPSLIIRTDLVRSSYNRYHHRIILGIKNGYKRFILVHEVLHSTGKKHCDGFRSHRNTDTFSPKVVVKIFGE